jgi:nucleotide-binding universal stress UspA family protein
MGAGPIVIGYDGAPGSAYAIRATGALLGGRVALVVVVWKVGLGHELIAERPVLVAGLPPASLDVRTADEFDGELAEHARMLAQEGAGLAHESGLLAEGVAIAEDPDVSVAEALVRVARERDAQSVALGHASDVAIGRITRDTIRHAPCPVLVARRPPEG